MDQIKLWAYLSKTGFERITAADAARLRRRDNNGRPDGRVFYSTHRAGERYPMTLRLITGKRAHFAYIGDGPPSHAGNGESLQHSLFKQALARLRTVTLRLNDGDHHLSIEHGQNEVLVDHPSGRFYRTDTHWRFSSSTLLDKRWLGSVHVEVNHTHEVGPDKASDFLSLDMAMVEVDVPKFLAFNDGEEATSQQCEAYLSRVDRFLSNPPYFLSATILANPISDVIRENEQRINEARKRAAASEAELRTTISAKSTLEAQLSEVTLEKARLAEKLSDIRTKLDDKTTAHINLKKENGEITQERDVLKSHVATLRSDHTFVSTMFWPLVAVFVCAFGFMMYKRFLTSHSESTTDIQPPGIESTNLMSARLPSALPITQRISSSGSRNRSHHKKANSPRPESHVVVVDDAPVDTEEHDDGPTTAN